MFQSSNQAQNTSLAQISKVAPSDNPISLTDNMATNPILLTDNLWIICGVVRGRKVQDAFKIGSLVHLRLLLLGMPGANERPGLLVMDAGLRRTGRSLLGGVCRLGRQRQDVLDPGPGRCCQVQLPAAALPMLPVLHGQGRFPVVCFIGPGRRGRPGAGRHRHRAYLVDACEKNFIRPTKNHR